MSSSSNPENDPSKLNISEPNQSSSSYKSWAALPFTQSVKNHFKSRQDLLEQSSVHVSQLHLQHPPKSKQKHLKSKISSVPRTNIANNTDFQFHRHIISRIQFSTTTLLLAGFQLTRAPFPDHRTSFQSLSDESIQNDHSTMVKIPPVPPPSLWKQVCESVKHLNLSDNNISSLPASLGDLILLETLNLRRNAIRFLPPSIGNLKLLKSIDIRCNRIHQLPDEITLLKFLTTLLLSNNRISSLPNSIGDLHSLVSLDISNNPISNLPLSFSQLFNLEKLESRSTAMSLVPTVIFLLPSLRRVTFMGSSTLHSFDTLPCKVTIDGVVYSFSLSENYSLIIKPCEKLSRLNPSGGKESIPSLEIDTNEPPRTVSEQIPPQPKNASDSKKQTNITVSLSERLLSLNFDFNILSTLPYQISIFCPQLSHFSASHNRISNIPSLFCTHATRIQKLVLSYNSLRHFPSTPLLTSPDWFQLRFLDLSHNQITSISPNLFINTTNLVDLILAFNSLRFLPNSLSCCKKLENLQLGSNALSPHGIDISWKSLEKLRTLDLSKNSIHHLPPSFSSLSSLQHLSLRSNRLRILPDFLIESLPSLTRLRCDDNSLEYLPENLHLIKNLESLYLEKNNIQYLPNSIGCLINLKHLYISRNQLMSVPLSLLNLSGCLEIVDLFDNPPLYNTDIFNAWLFGFSNFWATLEQAEKELNLNLSQGENVLAESESLTEPLNEEGDVSSLAMDPDLDPKNQDLEVSFILGPVNRNHHVPPDNCVESSSSSKNEFDDQSLEDFGDIPRISWPSPSPLESHTSPNRIGSSSRGNTSSPITVNTSSSVRSFLSEASSGITPFSPRGGSHPGAVLFGGHPPMDRSHTHTHIKQPPQLTIDLTECDEGSQGSYLEYEDDIAGPHVSGIGPNTFPTHLLLQNGPHAQHPPPDSNIPLGDQPDTRARDFESSFLNSELGLSDDVSHFDEMAMFPTLENDLSNSGPQDLDFVDHNTSNMAPSPLSDWEIDWKQLLIQKSIGSGAFGKVFMAGWHSRLVAVKTINISADASFDPRVVASIRNEVSLLAMAKHPNIVELLGASLQPPNIAIITEFVRGTSLRNLIKDHPDILTSSWIRQIPLAIAEGMAYLHARSIIHRDLTSRNILIALPNGVAKVCDFGLAQHMSGTFVPRAGMITGSVRWMAPEVLRCERYNQKADVYSFGIILWELLYRKKPYYTISQPRAVAAGVAYHNIRPDHVAYFPNVPHPRDPPIFGNGDIFVNPKGTEETVSGSGSGQVTSDSHSHLSSPSHSHGHSAHTHRKKKSKSIPLSSTSTEKRHSVNSKDVVVPQKENPNTIPAVVVEKTKKVKPNRPTMRPPWLFVLMRQCWAEDPIHRPSFRQIVQIIHDNLDKESRTIRGYDHYLTKEQVQPKASPSSIDQLL